MKKTRIFCDGDGCDKDITDGDIIKVTSRGKGIEGEMIITTGKSLEYCPGCAAEFLPENMIQVEIAPPSMAEVIDGGKAEES